MNTETIKKMDNFIESAGKRDDKLNNGEKLLLSSSRFTQKYLIAEHIVIDDIVWNNDLQDFLNALRDIKLDKIIVTNTSTALMKLLHFLVENGCVIEGTSTVEDIDGFGKPKYGLLVKVN